MNRLIENEKPYSVIAIANELIKRAKDKGLDITHLKLQKLVYFAHALNLALGNGRLIKDEVEAWKYGPVIPDLFRECAVYGKDKIYNYITTAIIENDPFMVEIVTKFIDPDDVFSNDLLGAIIDIYGSKTAVELSNMAHSKNSAWDITREQHKEGKNRNYIIPTDMIARAEKVRFGIKDDGKNLGGGACLAS